MMLAKRIRARLRRYLPEGLRRFVAQARRRANDARAPAKFEFTTAQFGEAEMAPFVCAADITQPIRRTAHYEGKMHNIALAVARLNRVCLARGQAVSFWQAIGEPTAKLGFQLGRGIVGDKLSADVGGGLCQIASLLYELGLRTGLTVLERHPHSRDLYTEDNRFTPLGLDATVVWGFKDVRVANAYGQRVVFVFDIDAAASTLRGRVFSEKALPLLDLELSRHDDGGVRFAEVSVRDNHGATTVVSRDSYIIDAT
jgi:vancomycin resistance protein VanW